MANTPLAVRWGGWTFEEPQAGALSVVSVELENAGTVTWGEKIQLAYHWLDDRDNPIVWDGKRTPLPEVAPGERVTVDAQVRAPIPPGSYRFAFDLVVEHRAWFSELGGEGAVTEIDVIPRTGTTRTDLPAWLEPAADWRGRVSAAHSEGYGVVAGAIAWQGRLGRGRPRELAPYVPGPDACLVFRTR